MIHQGEGRNHLMVVVVVIIIIVVTSVRGRVPASWRRWQTLFLCEDLAPALHQSWLDQLGKQWVGFRRVLLLFVQLKWTVLGL